MKHQKERTRRRTLLLVSGISLSTVAFLSYYLKDHSNQIKARRIFEKGRRKFSIKKPSLPLDKAGHPDPNDIEDNKMVSEGSMYPVEYYNKKNN